MSEVLEAVMIACFGASWPLALYKSYTSRTARGKSLPFLVLILTGYAVGILNKFLGQNLTYVLFFYVLNFVMVFCDLILYFRNRKLDKIGESAA